MEMGLKSPSNFSVKSWVACHVHVSTWPHSQSIIRQSANGVNAESRGGDSHRSQTGREDCIAGNTVTPD